MNGKAPAPSNPEDLTADWFTLVLRAAGYEVAVVSIAQHPIVQNVGLQGLLVRCDLHYAAPTNAPASIVVKLLTPDPANRRHALSLNLWDRETQFYREIAPYLSLRVPKCHYIAADPERAAYALVFEDLTSFQQPAPVSLAQAALVMRSAAALHAPFWGRVAQALPSLETQRSFERSMRERIEQNWNDYLDLARTRVPARQIDLVERSVSRFGEGLTGELLPPTLIHYDFRAGNMLFDGERDVVVLDWQSPLNGQGTGDVCWFLSDSLSPADRINHGQDLRRIYLDQLVAHGVDRSDLKDFDLQFELSKLRRLPMSVLSATTFKHLAHVDDSTGPVWWARDYEELEAVWRTVGGST